MWTVGRVEATRRHRRDGAQKAPARRDSDATIDDVVSPTRRQVLGDPPCAAGRPSIALSRFEQGFPGISPCRKPKPDHCCPLRAPGQTGRPDGDDRKRDLVRTQETYPSGDDPARTPLPSSDRDASEQHVRFPQTVQVTIPAQRRTGDGIPAHPRSNGRRRRLLLRHSIL